MEKAIIFFLSSIFSIIAAFLVAFFAPKTVGSFWVIFSLLVLATHFLILVLRIPSKDE